jgi:hypothetical protein
MPKITKVTVQSDKQAYEFTVERDGMAYVATSDQGEIGGLNTAADTWTELEEMLIDSVETWENC